MFYKYYFQVPSNDVRKSVKPSYSYALQMLQSIKPFYFVLFWIFCDFFLSFSPVSSFMRLDSIDGIFSESILVVYSNKKHSTVEQNYWNLWCGMQENMQTNSDQCENDKYSFTSDLNSKYAHFQCNRNPA